MKKILICGLGSIGKMYQSILASNYEVSTLDPFNADANYASVAELDDLLFDIGIVCSPNHTHFDVAIDISENVSTCLVEKPGVASVREWTILRKIYGNRIQIIKNNLYRDSIYGLQIPSRMTSIAGYWHLSNRIPSPGSWFTDKSKSFGGASVDLGSHLLYMILAFAGYDAESIEITSVSKYQNTSLEELTDTRYGTIDKNGVFDVDDEAIINGNIKFRHKSIPFHISVRWTGNEDVFKIVSSVNNDLLELNLTPLCPESAYDKMVDLAKSGFATVVNDTVDDLLVSAIEQIINFQ